MDLIFGVQDLCVPPGWRFDEHQHDGIEITGVLRGRVALATVGGVWHATAGHITVVPPQLPHRWFSDDGAELAVTHLVHVPRDLEQRLLPGHRPRVIPLNEPQFAEYASVFSRVVALSGDSERERRHLLRAYLDVFLLVLVEGVRAQDPVTAAIDEAAAYMRAHLEEPVTVAGVARLFYLSETTFRRRFRAAFGVSPKYYLLELRLTRARELLADSGLPVQDVAERLGFFDAAHLSSAFRRRYGLAPSSWRDNARSAQNVQE